MKKSIIAIFLLCISVGMFSENHKDATKILNNALELIKNNTIETHFGMVIKQTGSSDLYKTKGVFTMKANKFILQMDKMVVCFDGKTQWSYVAEINEVSITEPSDKELIEVNPMLLLEKYISVSKINLNKKRSTKYLFYIQLIPKKSTDDFLSISVKINKSNGYPLFIQLIDKKGMISVLSLTNFRKKKDFSDSDFKFNFSKYKNLEVNDLR